MTYEPKVGDRIRVKKGSTATENVYWGHEGVVVGLSGEMVEDPRVLEDWGVDDIATSLGNAWVWFDEEINGHHSWQMRYQSLKCLDQPVDPKEVDEALESIRRVYDTPTGEHPSIIEMREHEAEAIAQGYTKGDVNHLVQPIIGMLRLRQQAGKPLDESETTYAIERLEKACKAELAWLNQQGLL